MYIEISVYFYLDVIDDNYYKKQILISDYNYIYKKFNKINYIYKNKDTLIDENNINIMYYNIKNILYHEVIYVDENLGAVSHYKNIQKFFYYKYTLTHFHFYLYSIFIFNKYHENITIKDYSIDFIGIENLVTIKKINLCCLYHLNNFIL